jgi:hypothetical protein
MGISREEITAASKAICEPGAGEHPVYDTGPANRNAPGDAERAVDRIEHALNVQQVAYERDFDIKRGKGSEILSVGGVVLEGNDAYFSCAAKLQDGSRINVRVYDSEKVELNGKEISGLKLALKMTDVHTQINQQIATSLNAAEQSVESVEKNQAVVPKKINPSFTR